MDKPKISMEQIKQALVALAEQGKIDATTHLYMRDPCPGCKGMGKPFRIFGLWLNKAGDHCNAVYFLCGDCAHKMAHSETLRVAIAQNVERFFAKLDETLPTVEPYITPSA
jgi:hypothetical protein